MKRYTPFQLFKYISIIISVVFLYYTIYTIICNEMLFRFIYGSYVDYNRIIEVSYNIIKGLSSEIIYIVVRSFIIFIFVYENIKDIYSSKNYSDIKIYTKSISKVYYIIIITHIIKILLQTIIIYILDLERNILYNAKYISVKDILIHNHLILGIFIGLTEGFVLGVCEYNIFNYYIIQKAIYNQYTVINNKTDNKLSIDELNFKVEKILPKISTSVQYSIFILYIILELTTFIYKSIDSNYKYYNSVIGYYSNIVDKKDAEINYTDFVKKYYGIKNIKQFSNSKTYPRIVIKQNDSLVFKILYLFTFLSIHLITTGYFYFKVQGDIANNLLGMQLKFITMLKNRKQYLAKLPVIDHTKYNISNLVSIQLFNFTIKVDKILSNTSLRSEELNQSLKLTNDIVEDSSSMLDELVSKVKVIYDKVYAQSNLIDMVQRDITTAYSINNIYNKNISTNMNNYEDIVKKDVNINDSINKVIEKNKILKQNIIKLSLENINLQNLIKGVSKSIANETEYKNNLSGMISEIIINLNKMDLIITNQLISNNNGSDNKIDTLKYALDNTKSILFNMNSEIKEEKMKSNISYNNINIMVKQIIDSQDIIKQSENTIDKIIADSLYVSEENSNMTENFEKFREVSKSLNLLSNKSTKNLKKLNNKIDSIKSSFIEIQELVKYNKNLKFALFKKIAGLLDVNNHNKNIIANLNLDINNLLHNKNPKLYKLSSYTENINEKTIVNKLINSLDSKEENNKEEKNTMEQEE